MKLEIGAGNGNAYGFIHTDLNLVPNHHVEVVCRGESLPFLSDTFEYVYMLGVFEHFNYEQAKEALRECYRVLKAGCTLDFTTPDLEAVCRIIVNDRLPFKEERRSPLEYALGCLYGGQDRPGQIHQWGWTRASISTELVNVGFSRYHITDDAYEPGTHLRVVATKV